MAYITGAKQTKEMISTFAGLDSRERISTGAWNNMRNMTISKYPCAASRNKRATQLFSESVSVDGSTEKRRASGEHRIFAAQSEDGEISWLESKITPGTILSAYDIKLRSTRGISKSVSGNIAPGLILDYRPKYGGIVRLGRDLFLYPYAVHSDYGSDETGTQLFKTEISANSDSGWCKIEVVPTDEDGTQVTVTSSASAPASPANGAYWYDTTSKGLYRYSTQSSEWVAWSATCLKISVSSLSSSIDAAKDTFKGLKAGDAVSVFFTNGNKEYESSHIIQSVSDDLKSILLKGYVDGFTSLTEITVTRKAPYLQYAVAWLNRIWGCCYGEHDGQFLNEVYGSALGDMDNFFIYEGTAADSYTVSVGTGGKFTGIAQLEDCVVFFKEDRYYILTGSEPPFSLTEYSGAGIQDGSEKSAVVINGYVYYKSYGGIMRMSPDSRPVRVSDALGVDRWENAVAGTDGEKYYISMKRTDSGEYEFFVYDTLTGSWAQEENPAVGAPAAILRYRNSAFAIGSVPTESVKQVGDTTATGKFTPLIEYLDAENVNKLTVENLGGWSSEEAEDESVVIWNADSGVLGLDEPNSKFIRQIQIRGKLADNAMISIEMSYDGHDDEREPVYLEEGDVKGTFNALHSPARRCDNFRLHFSGHGKCVIYSVTITTEDGEDYVQR